MVPTEGLQPVVYADWLHAVGQPTILVYGHYDVQPVDPVEVWDNPPFEPKVQDGYFLGRGVDDDKGGLLQVKRVVADLVPQANKMQSSIFSSAVQPIRLIR